MKLTLPGEFAAIDDATREQLSSFLNPSSEIEDDRPNSNKLGAIMYIEEKPKQNADGKSNTKPPKDPKHPSNSRPGTENHFFCFNILKLERRMFPVDVPW